MHVARWIVISFLILAILFTYSPSVQKEVSRSWEQARPGVVVLMDELYAALRSLVAGPEFHDRRENQAPGVDFDLIITRDRVQLF